MTNPSDVPDPFDGLPDADDPAAVRRWLAAIEIDAARLSARHKTVLEMAAASHRIYLLKKEVVPFFPDDSARYRAYGLLGAGLSLTVAFSVVLTHLSSIDSQDVPVLTMLPIAALLWLFMCLYETFRGHQYRAGRRREIEEQIRNFAVERDLAKALLEDDTFPGHMPENITTTEA